MGTTRLDARIRQAEHRLAAAGVLVEELPVRLPGTGGAVRVPAAGEGQPYLLLHGTALSAARWIPLMPHLSGDGRATAIPRRRPAGGRRRRQATTQDRPGAAPAPGTGSRQGRNRCPRHRDGVGTRKPPHHT